MSNRVALVTGGTGGIGTAICQELYTQGFTVVAGYNSGGNHDKAKAWQAEQRSNGFEFDVAYGDVSDSESARQCVEGIAENMATFTAWSTMPGSPAIQLFGR